MIDPIFKRALLFNLLLFSSISFLGQAQVDPRIQNYLGEEVVRKIVTQHPEQLKYYNNLLYNSYELINQEDLNGSEKIEILNTLPLKNGETLTAEDLEQRIKDKTFDIFQVNLRRNKTTDRYFKIGNTSKIFVLRAATSDKKQHEK